MHVASCWQLCLFCSLVAYGYFIFENMPKSVTTSVVRWTLGAGAFPVQITCHARVC
jgi:hypothetical protein